MINTVWEKLFKNKTKKANYEWSTIALTAILFNFGLEVLTNAVRQIKEIH